MAEITIENVTKEFQSDKGGSVTAVHSVGLSIRDGEFLVLVGPSGCGKSTLLRMIAGLEQVSSGEIYIAGKLSNDTHPKDRDIAMVFQNYALYPHMSVEENLTFGLRLRKVPKKEISSRVGMAAEMLGLSPYLKRKPKELSGGQQQRVALGRAIVRKPQVFLFDEPLSNLDAMMRVQMRVEISSLCRRLGTTSVYVTHDQVEAMTMGERIVCMQGGKVQQIGTPLELYGSPANQFVARFIGVPPMNLIPCYIEDNSIAFPDTPAHISLENTGLPYLAGFGRGRKTLGIRPESFTLSRNGYEGFTGEVVAVERLGAETLVYCNIGKHRVVGRFAPDEVVKNGEKITLGLRSERGVHFFEESGAAAN